MFQVLFMFSFSVDVYQIWGAGSQFQSESIPRAALSADYGGIVASGRAAVDVSGPKVFSAPVTDCAPEHPAAHAWGG
jgi:hypothetical protein